MRSPSTPHLDVAFCKLFEQQLSRGHGSPSRNACPSNLPLFGSRRGDRGRLRRISTDWNHLVEALGQAANRGVTKQVGDRDVQGERALELVTQLQRHQGIDTHGRQRQPSLEQPSAHLSFGVLAAEIRRTRSAYVQVHRIASGRSARWVPPPSIVSDSLHYRLCRASQMVQGRGRSARGGAPAARPRAELQSGYLRRFGGESGIRQQTEAQYQGSWLEWRGIFGPDETAHVMAGLDVLVVPSRWYENSPNVILEAQAFNVPIVATGLGGMAELVRDEIDGLLFELNNAQDPARQLQRAFEDRELLSRLLPTPRW
jgi:glycosyltransferase involved in cell wall biosynthesis